MADPTKPTRRYTYETDGTEIYRQSFATIRAESDLARFDDDAATVAVRMIHAAGDTGLAAHIQTHPRLVTAAREALNSGAPVFADATMIGTGITRARLPRDNDVICTLRDPRTPGLAKDWQTTRSAAAVSLWTDRLEGAVVAIGNAPTALFHLLELIADGGPRPAAIIGVPVGFIGAAESKEALRNNPWDVPWLIVEGRRGGSALAVSALNALARENELPA
ncbi:MAG TPA: precorrin-8X methylmutase [Propionibacterium sp.]|jgi:precorrin-8X/cobalt-precorrin-8 methylmutase|nr:precorrin-8X methylmutase [Propionibacterium sp.]